MQYSFLSLSLALALTGCTNRKCCDIIDTSMAIHYVDAQGHDWLRTNNVTTDGMEVYFVHDGITDRVYHGNYDAPKSIRLYREPDTAKTTLQLSPDFSTTDPKARMLLQFPDHSVDTVQCRFNLSNGNILCTEVRYNGQLRWSSQLGIIRAFTIKK